MFLDVVQDKGLEEKIDCYHLCQSKRSLTLQVQTSSILELLVVCWRGLVFVELVC